MQQTVKQLTTALEGSSSAKDSWTEIVKDNQRLRTDKSRLVNQLHNTEKSLRAENLSLSKMVQYTSEDHFINSRERLLNGTLPQCVTVMI